MPFAQKNRLLLLLVAATISAPTAQAGFFDDLFGGKNPFNNPFGGNDRPLPPPVEEPAPIIMGKPKPVVVGPFSAVANAASINELIRLSLADKTGSLKIGKNQYVVKEIAARLYSLRDFQPLFVDANGPTSLGHAMRTIFVETAPNRGLSNSFYWSTDAETRFAAKDTKSLGELDLLMAVSYLQYAADVSTGRINPQDASQNLVDIEYKKRSFNDYAFLNQIAASPDSLSAGLESLEPKHAAYKKMVQSMTRLRAAKKAGGWRRFVDDKQVNPGKTGKNIPALRERLVDLGMLAEGSERDPSPVYDAALVEAVKNFQEGAKLSADGILGAGTMKHLDKPIESRIAQLQANLERFRLLPKDFGPNHIFVDLGRQHLTLTQNGQETMNMRVIVGQTLRQTPSFPDEIGYAVMRPYWFAPGSIVVRDILPQAMQNPDYFSMLKMKILDNGREIDPYQFDADYWMQFTVQNPPPFTFREDPGPHNSLGFIKFQLTKNKHDIYMHDTNNRDLFANNLRANSSGCIRVQRPVELAAALLANEGHDVNSVQAMIDDETITAKKVMMKNKMPVFVMGTTVALVNGNLMFGPDIYGQDKKIIDALNGLRIVPTADTINFFGDRDSTL